MIVDFSLEILDFLHRIYESEESIDILARLVSGKLFVSLIVIQLLLGMLIPLGLMMLAPVLLGFGTEQQKQDYLPKILSGEHYWCQGYSEPGSGSDLASLQLKAERDNGAGRIAAAS